MKKFNRFEDDKEFYQKDKKKSKPHRQSDKYQFEDYEYSDVKKKK